MTAPSSPAQALNAVQGPSARLPALPGRRTLWVACGAHMLHDGLTDVLVLLLPLWRAEFGLAYAEVGLIRSLYTGGMAGFQVPVGFLAEHVGGRVLLVLGTVVAAAGFLLMGMSSGFALLAAALVLGGIGASVQHPIGSTLVSRAFPGTASRAALATYNFTGDLGKMALPAAASGLLLLMTWRHTVLALGLLGFLGAAALWALLPPTPPTAARRKPEESALPEAYEPRTRSGGFSLLLSIGVIDSATRSGFMLFLPFLLNAKGASVATLGLALALIFAGGAAGKLVCGLIGARLGVLATVILTEGLTALGILVLLPLPLGAALAVLPLLGIALNGTSSVLYGTVPELVPEHRRERAFGVFYTGSIGGSALAPGLYGLFGDLAGVPAALMLVAAVVLITLPLAWGLRSVLAVPVSAS